MVSRIIDIVWAFSVSVYWVINAIVTYDSTLLIKLLYNRLVKLDEGENVKETKKKNIHQQLEEKPDELSDDSDGAYCLD